MKHFENQKTNSGLFAGIKIMVFFLEFIPGSRNNLGKKGFWFEERRIKKSVMKIQPVRTAGVRSFPLIPMFLLYVLYLFLVSLDILSTYVATPDLNFEANPVILSFQMNWLSIVIASLLGSTFLFLIFWLSISSIYQGQRERFFSLLGITVFICHFSYSCFTIVNNILSGIFLGELDLSFLSSIAEWYINSFVMGNDFFYPAVFSLHVALSFVFVRIAFPGFGSHSQ